MKKTIFTFITIFLLCKTIQGNTATFLPEADNIQSIIIGIWATPSILGSNAEVFEFKKDGNFIHHSFKCPTTVGKKIEKGEVTYSKYSIEHNKIKIRSHSKGKAISLDMQSLEYNTIKISQETEGQTASLTLFRTLKILPLCPIFDDTDQLSLTEDENLIIGKWAMSPLANGIANVIEFNPDGKGKIHSFTCPHEKTETEPVEAFSYSVINNGAGIHILSEHGEQTLKILSFKPLSMKLSMEIKDTPVEFTYFRTLNISPSCFLHIQLSNEDWKQTPYSEKDFIPSPYIPDHKDIDGYIGKWANEKGFVQFEIIREKNGKTILSTPPNDDWRHLYNNISWSENELHYQNFAYTEKESLFKHPYHKHTSYNIIALTENPNKIKHSFFISGKRYDYILSRTP